MKKSYKIFKYAFTAICLVWVIISAVFSERFNIYFSSFGPWIQEGESVIEHFSEDHSVDFELKPGETLSLPITFEKRVSRLGIYLGEQTDSLDKYIFQLEDKYGMILGKAVKALSEIKANDFVYLSSKAIISTSDTYYVKISSESDDKNSAPLNIVVSSAASFQAAPFSVGENESESTLIIDTRYQATRNIVVVIDVILLLIVAVVWLWGLRFIRSDLKEIVIKWLNTIPWKKVNLLAILVLIAANIVLLFFPEKQNMVQCGNQKRITSTEQVISLEDGVVLEQHIKQSEGQINVISVLFATYTQKIKGEKVYLELLDDTNQNIIYSKAIASEEIYDNEYKDFLLPETMDLGSSEYCIRLRSDAASDNLHVAVYLNDNRSPEMYAQRNGEALDYNLIFDMSNQIKVYRFDVSLVINGILLILLMLYVWNFIHFRHAVIRSIICSCLLSVLLLPPVLSVLNYRTISMNGMVSSFWDRSSLSLNREYNKEILDDSLTVEKEYDYSGVLRSVNERTELPVSSFISDITLEFDHDLLKPTYHNISVYWVNDKTGYNDRQSFVYTYIPQGENRITFSIPCNEAVRSMMISVMAVSDKTSKLSEVVMPLSKVNLNQNTLQTDFFSLKTVLVYLFINIITLAIFLWKYFAIDKKIENFSFTRKISISTVFVLIASIYGVFFAFLMPTYRIPDEHAHIRMLYADLGDSSIPDVIRDAVGREEKADLDKNIENTIDITSYIEASKNKLDDYSFNYKSPSIKMIRRPGQTLGVLIGQLLHLPAYWILELGEIGGLAVYIALGAITLKIIPYKKNLMMMIMLSPIVIQEAGSFAYDSFTNAVSYLTIAYILYLKVKAQKFGWKQLLPLIPMAICLLLGKVIYVLLLLLIFIIPLDKLELKFGKFILNKEWVTHHKAITATSIAALLCIGAVGALAFLNFAGYGNISEMLLGYIMSFSQMIRLFYTNMIVNSQEWLRGLTTYYGWYDNPPNDLFMWFIIISVFIFAFMHHNKNTDNNTQINQSNNTRTFTGANLLVWYGVFVILFCVVQMTMISWGFLMYGIDPDLPYSVSMRLLPRIEGVQGRYFSPILPLIFIPLHTKKDFLGFIPAWLYKICYFLIAAIFPISLLLLRYWGVGSW